MKARKVFPQNLLSEFQISRKVNEDQLAGIEHVLSKLSVEEQELANMRYREGLTYKEIAQRTGLKNHIVNCRISKLLMRMTYLKIRDYATLGYDGYMATLSLNNQKKEEELLRPIMDDKTRAKEIIHRIDELIWVLCESEKERVAVLNGNFNSCKLGKECQILMEIRARQEVQLKNCA